MPNIFQGEVGLPLAQELDGTLIITKYENRTVVLNEKISEKVVHQDGFC